MAQSFLSNRGTEVSVAGADEMVVWSVISNLWDPVKNPDGYLSLGIAENRLMHKELRDFLNSKQLVDEASRALTYGDGVAGSKHFRAAVSEFMNGYFNPFRPVVPDHVMVTNGCSAGIEHASWVLANPGEGILLGRPYYRAFLPDIRLRTGVKVVTVAFGEVDPIGADCVSKYEEALLKSNAEGVKVRALMLCHPNNPLGRCYSRDTIVALMKLCQKYKLHLISDEIYALSVWENTVDELPTPLPAFESVLSIDTTGIIDASLVHVLWGFSKDFGANGIRIGIAASQSNDPFLTACRACSIYSSPSSLTENAATAILSDSAFLSSYVKTNQQRLSAAYTHAVKTVRKHDIEYLPGVNAAFFLFINLGKKYLQNTKNDISKEPTKEITRTIYDKLMQNKVFVVHGDATGAEQPGWFRLVFAHPPDWVEEGVKRIAEALRE